ncbi:unnamed protein product [Aphanomyces euteiches]|nr:hypothetical protein Ae201684P_003261 [Aphanomyces euteiches]KAH9109860.1 hypothetical protein AeMF1_015157 [Aphanomyces euteiches]KAH9120065.1 hypothetical protein LEN26_011300 [Aphanomyces euteiches]KAH9154198.1 hypothetical protein AeRB84_003663 [Aphanomyces euteiches]KAH9189824.1 hypothetical protein AeNC1_008194 [Aphanomyces euteiches]
MGARPIVLVCSWLNGKPRVVQKYAGLYESLGYPTFTLLCNATDMFLPETQVHTKSFHAFQTWLDTTTAIEPNEPLVIVPHLMSNGGCWSWYCFENHLVRAGIPFRVPSIILDSAMNRPDDMSNSGVALAASMTNPIVRQVVAAFFSVAMPAYARFVQLAFGQNIPLEVSFQRFIERDAAIPKLFLYSSADTTIGPDHVEHAIESANKLQTKVEKVDFETSKHVAHYMDKPDVYVDAVERFLNEYVVRRDEKELQLVDQTSKL